ncbi:MAG: hypothetical protein FWE80_06330 [Oscillospiraceae bacterium]|nr:hypothetical protein [Oscillospiraceae bacterium]
MPFCPQCRGEYRQEFDTCGSCGVPLVDKLSPQPNTESPVDERQNMPVLLCETDCDEAALIAERLMWQHIPSKREDHRRGERRYGGYLGTGVYVPARELERAQELLRHCRETDYQESPEFTYIDENSDAAEDQTDDEMFTEESPATDEEWGKRIKTAKKQGAKEGLLLLLVIAGTPVALYLLAEFVIKLFG